MRGATGDVAAAERQLNAIEDLLSRSCRAAVGSGLALTAASASTRPPNVRGASLLRSRKALSNPSVHRARSRGASVLRLTHAPAAALHARRSTPKGVSRRARPRRKGASRGPSPQPSPPPPLRRPTPPPPKPPPTDAQPQRAALPHRPLHPPRRRPPPGPPYPRVPALGRKQTSPPGDASAGHPRAS